MIHFGIVKPGSTLVIPFDTFAAATGAPTALSNFAVGDILVYKDSGTTARASTTGFTANTTFSSVTGINEAIIDLSSDATGDFYKSGSNYFVVISPVTADGQTLAFVAASFSIGYPDALLNTSIATLSSQTSFTLTSGPAEDDALNGLFCLIHDKASAVQTTWAIVLDYTGSTKTVTLATLPAATFTIAAIDNIHFFGPMPLQPATIGRPAKVTATGAIALDWSNIEGPTTAQNLSGTTVKTATDIETDTQDIQTRLPASLQGGNMKSDIFAISTDTAAADNAESFFDGTGYAGTNNVIPLVTNTTTATNLTNAPTAGDFTAVMKTSLNAATVTATVSDKTGFSLVAGYDPAKTAAQAGDAMTLTAGERTAIATATLARSLAAESYAADGAVPTLSQVLYMIHQMIGDFAISGTTISVKKLDGSTEAATFTLDSSTSPTSRTRAT